MENKEQKSNEAVKRKSKMAENDSKSSESEDEERNIEEINKSNKESTNQQVMNDNKDSETNIQNRILGGKDYIKDCIDNIISNNR